VGGSGGGASFGADNKRGRRGRCCCWSAMQPALKSIFSQCARQLTVFETLFIFPISP